MFFKDQWRNDGSEFKPDTASSFQKTPAVHWRAQTYSALKFWLSNKLSTWHIISLISLLWNLNVMCHCFREPIESFFLLPLSVKSLDLHLFPILPNRKPYNKYLISLVFLICTVNYGSSFFSIDLWCHALHLDQKLIEKNWVCNLQYAPRTCLTRSIYGGKGSECMLQAKIKI